MFAKYLVQSVYALVLVLLLSFHCLSASSERCERFYNNQSQSIKLVLAIAEGKAVYLDNPQKALSANHEINGIQFWGKRYQEQKKVYRMAFKSQQQWYSVRTSSADFRYLNEQDLIFIIPDTHREDYSKILLAKILKEIHWDWVGIEMFMQSLQGDIDTIATKGKPKNEKEEAIGNIRASLDRSWTPWLQFGTNPGDKTVYQDMFDNLMKQMKKNTRIIAMDVPDDRPSYPKAFSIGWRNLKWTQTLPNQGRGIILGGSSHFFGVHKGILLQDFILDKYPNRKLIVFDWPNNRFIHFQILTENSVKGPNTNGLHDLDPNFNFVKE